MAKATQTTQKVADSKKGAAAPAAQPAAKANVPAVKTQTALAVPAGIDFAADKSAGMEGTTAESFAIPFLIVLQKGSPQVDETAGGVVIDGAKAGMFYENVTSRLMDGKEGVTVIPCAYRRVFIRWGARGTEGAGFKGELTQKDVADARAAGLVKELDGRLYYPLPDGSINEKRCDRIADTRNHYVLLLDEKKGQWMQAVLSLVSTQIKKSKNLMSALANVRIGEGSDAYMPASFANKVRLTTIAESNDKGSWYGVTPALAGFVDRPDIYQAAKAFHDTVLKGTVEVKYEDTELAQGAAGAGDSQAATPHVPPTSQAGNKF